MRSAAMRSSLSWEITRREEETVVSFDGELDENTNDLPSLASSLAGLVALDLANVRRITSEGVRRWINFIRALSNVTQLAYERCSVSVVLQLNMVQGFQSNAEIRSFFAPYFCENTGEEEERLLRISDVPNPLEPPSFASERGVMVLDDLPERYLGFLLKGAES